MSKFVDEIIIRLDQWPEEWVPISCGVRTPAITISMVGNSALLSVIDVHVDDLKIPTTYRDRYRLERAVNRWYRNASLKMLRTR